MKPYFNMLTEVSRLYKGEKGAIASFEKGVRIADHERRREDRHFPRKNIDDGEQDEDEW